MNDNQDQETTRKKVTSNFNVPSNEYSVSEERTTKVRNDDSTNAIVISVLIFLAIGGGALAYFLNSRPVPTPIIVPSAADTVKENKSTIIERNNTIIREVSPASPQPTPKVEVNIPAATIQPVAPAPTVTVTAKPTATPAPITKPVTPSASPTPTTSPQ